MVHWELTAFDPSCESGLLNFEKLNTNNADAKV
jgi:hypothetical protein